MGNLADQIAAILSQVQHPGEFYASGTHDMHPFQLQVDGIGPIAMRLERRIAEPLAPPADWQRPAELQCGCQYCNDLSRFLASPNESSRRLEAAQDVRSHVEHRVQWDHSDLDCTTDKRGRPYTLICTKNQASYERRVRQREQDFADRERLR